ncbi:hypothetical protein [Vibrio atypicus]|uniref:hypothetical protein n=1 Tax=Vibrio atypicus TaxID=558271 RepID=UPI00135AC22F|nr:hypothetical protein [Vibrio atypicus]
MFNVIPIIAFVWCLSSLSYANVSADYKDAWFKCKGYEEASVLTLENGKIETICTPKKYSEVSVDVTAVFEKIYYKCGEVEKTQCISSALYYPERNLTLINLQLNIKTLLDAESHNNEESSKVSLAKSVPSYVSKTSVLVLNPELGRIFDMETDYGELKDLLDYEYGLETVAIGIVSHDGEQRYVGYARMSENGGLEHWTELNSFATPEQLLFYDCDFSNRQCSEVTDFEVIELN